MLKFKRPTIREMIRERTQDIIDGDNDYELIKLFNHLYDCNYLVRDIVGIKESEAIK